LRRILKVETNSKKQLAQESNKALLRKIERLAAKKKRQLCIGGGKKVKSRQGRWGRLERAEETRGSY